MSPQTQFGSFDRLLRFLEVGFTKLGFLFIFPKGPFSDPFPNILEKRD